MKLSQLCVFHLIFVFFNCNSFAQKKTISLFKETSPSESVNISSQTIQHINSLKSAKLLSLNKEESVRLFFSGGAFTMLLSTQSGTLELDLQESDILSPDFKVRSGEGKILDIEMPRFYKGKVAGIEHSFVTLSVLPSGVEGIISADGFNYTFGRIKEESSNVHIVYNSDEIPRDQPFECNTIEVEPNETDKNTSSDNLRKSINSNASACRAVEVYFEADHATYLSHGSNAASVAAYVANIFNNVALLYENEGVRILFNSLTVWTNPDPYISATNTSQALNLFDDIDFSLTGADLAYLMSTRKIGGGLAYIGTGTPVYENMTYRSVFRNCSHDRAFAVSGGMGTSVIAIPAYSYDVFVVAHELGHNFGLPHTHSCTWPGGAIDGCNAVDLPPCRTAGVPFDGGTIMSYCNNRLVGINLSKGFGPMPGDKMRAEVAAANCLGGVVSPILTVVSAGRCNPGSLSLSASGCPGTYNWYNTLTGGSSLGSSENFITPALNSTAIYYVSCTTEVSCLSRRTAVKAEIMEPLITENLITCMTNAQIPLTVAGCTIGNVEWYHSVSGGDLIAIGNNFTTPPVSATKDYYVQCRTTYCVSERVKITITMQTSCYCPSGNLICSNGAISLVRIASGSTQLLNNETNCSLNGYGNYRSINTNLNITGNYSITLNKPGTQSQGARVWIDFNGDGTFSSDEIIFTKPATHWFTETQTFTIPNGITPRTIRMRVKLMLNDNNIEPCPNPFAQGEVEDYTISLLGPPCPEILTLVSPENNYNGVTRTMRASALNGTIDASNAISGESDIIYESKAINLNPGFISNGFGTFLAKPGGCY